MDFTKILLLIVPISSLLISTNVMPTTSRASSLISMGNIFKDRGKTTQVIRVSPQVILFCKDTDNPTLCVETIIPYFQDKFNLIVALETEFETALNQSLKISNVIAQALVQPFNKSTSALNICKSQYKNIVDTINETAELLNQQNIVDVYYKFSTMMVDTSCEEAIVESHEDET
ncbi:hypothetical protein TanjilG_22549 [Lupinus angustifolius]|uniref:Pectinesterase inhibitor domain-containing protein n=2 Tax=Lupinus angustifolius TaxID=3871 RepID=A0A4P1RSG6_LUPAN|nr:hypothetical protein TanjilG_22549 [Lupinus angustifolius]